MEFSLSATITPRFNSKEIYSEWIQRDWFIFQEAIYDLGEEILKYMKDFITERSHREGKTGRLANAIKLYRFIGVAEIGWGIGKMSEMTQLASYWYLLNFGGMSWAGLTGKAVPGSFGGNAPDAMKAGTGVGSEHFDYNANISSKHGKDENFFMHVKNPINGIHYIEASQLTLNNEIINLLNKMTNEGEINEAKRHFVK